MLQLTINYEIMDCNYDFDDRNNGASEAVKLDIGIGEADRSEGKNTLTSEN